MLFSLMSPLRVVFILFCVMFFSCSNVNMSTHPDLGLSQEEKMDLDCFFNYVLFSESGVFVLFGSKPMVSVSIVHWPTSPSDYGEPISEEELLRTGQGIKLGGLIKRDPYNGWLVWKKIENKIKRNGRYLMTTHAGFSNSEELYLVDVQRLALVLAENYEDFKKVVEVDFHPLEVVFELENKNSVFWKKIFKSKNFVPKGLIFGYGKENALFFDWKWDAEELPPAVRDSLNTFSFAQTSFTMIENPFLYFNANSKNFEIPMFMHIEGDKTVHRYKKEKKKIKKVYRNKDMIETTLKRLQSG